MSAFCAVVTLCRPLGASRCEWLEQIADRQLVPVAHESEPVSAGAKPSPARSLPWHSSTRLERIRATRRLFRREHAVPYAFCAAPGAAACFASSAPPETPANQMIAKPLKKNRSL
jgi:hypothetical protein